MNNARNTESERFAPARKRSLRQAVLSLLVVAVGTGPIQSQAAFLPTNEGSETMATQNKFYCNPKALNPTERAHQKQLTDKLIAARTDVVETAKGYEFQFNPSIVSLAELTDWVAAESKCCEFFDFHIDVERRGSLLCLRLTGDEGIKPFIRAEFRVPTR